MHCTRKILDDLIWVGADDRRLVCFEGVYGVPDGVSYNSYLLLDEKTVLFDTVDKAVYETFFDNVAYGLNGRKLDYLVVSHMEPDHAATLELLVTRYPEAKIICNDKIKKLIAQFFRGIDLSPRIQTVREGDQLSTGRHTLNFVFAPMVHWPEVMMTFDSTDGILFSADAFGTFGALNGRIFADEVDFMHDWLSEARRYYTNIVGKYGPQVQDILKKASTLPIKYICPLHGFVWRKDFGAYIEKYQQWSSYTPEEKGVMIAYASVYGHTENVANILAAKLCERGMKVSLYDTSVTPASFIVADSFRFGTLVFASTTYNMGVFVTMENLLHDIVCHNLQNRKIALIENGSWSPNSGKLMREMLGKLPKTEFICDNLTIASSLADDQLAQLDALADAIVKGPAKKEEAPAAAAAAVKKWRCAVCGYEHEADTLPDDYVCPMCGVDRSNFSVVEEAAPAAAAPAAATGNKSPEKKGGARKKVIYNGIPAKEMVAQLVASLKADGFTFGDEVDIMSSIEEADRVVSIGQGIKNKKNLPLAEDLARAAGAAIGCSRPTAEYLGVLPRERFIGMTGKKFTGSLYIACGISGQLPHIKGMDKAGTVVAINKDPNAPIFTQCDYGMVGDMMELMPLLAEALRSGEQAAAAAEQPAAEKKTWKCAVCGYEHEAAELPDDFVCPLCGVDRTNFSAVAAAGNKSPEKKGGVRKKVIYNGIPAKEMVAQVVASLKADGYTFGAEVDIMSSIEEADRVVSIGQGIKNKKNLPAAEDLAKAVGAAIGCSRPTAELLGILPRERFIGMSGKKFNGSLYVACGISGQLPHVKGMDKAGTVVAINRDPNAPIFTQCDYGMVGDMMELMPLLAEALRSNEQPAAAAEQPAAEKKTWKCAVCGYEHEAAELPDDFVCPLCGVDRSNFSAVAAAGNKSPEKKDGARKKVIYNGIPAEEMVAQLVASLKADGYTFGAEVDIMSSIEEADRVVSIGQGIKNKKNLPLAEDLAKAAGAAIGCSRPTAEQLGVLPRDRFIGMSGKKFTGSLYIACGISGQMAHIKGMDKSGTVVVINKDPNAPIFTQCDYGMVGDMMELMPLLTQALKK